MKNKMGKIGIWSIVIGMLGLGMMATVLEAKEQVVVSVTGEDISSIVKDFNNSQSDVEVVLREKPFRNWRQAVNRFRLGQQIAEKGKTRQVVDIAFIDNNWLPEMLEHNWLADISGRIPSSQFVEGLLDVAQRGSSLYAVPFSNKGLVLYYRKDWHQKHDLKPPQSLQGLHDNALTLMQKEKLDHGVTLHYTAIHLDLLPFFWSNGGALVNNDQSVINSPQNLETLQRLHEMAQAGVFPSTKRLEALKPSYGLAQKEFLEGRSAYLITWNNRITPFNESPLAGKFGVLPIPPVHEGQPSYSVIGTWYFAINAFSEHQTGAIAFLNYFYSGDVLAAYRQQTPGFLSPLKSAQVAATPTPSSAPETALYPGASIADLQVAMQRMRHRLEHPKESELSYILENLLRQVILGQLPPSKALPLLHRRFESILEKP